MPRPVQGHDLYSQHELQSGVIAPFSEWGRDATTGTVAPVLNPFQGAASQRVSINPSLGVSRGPILDLNTDFVYDNVAKKKPGHINAMDAGIAVRRRMLPHIARYFDMDDRGFRNVLTDAEVNFEKGNVRRESLAHKLITAGTVYDLKGFDAATPIHADLMFAAEVDQIRNRRRHDLSIGIKRYIRSEYGRIVRLESLLVTAKSVVRAIKDLHTSVAAGQTPDLQTVERIVRTSQTYAQMPELLCDAAFHGMIDPTYIFLDFAAHAELLQVAIFLGKANFGLIAPTKRQARAFLREIMGEDLDSVLPFHVPMRNLLLSRMEAICDWRPHREIIAKICREVIDGTRSEGQPERRQLWPIR